MTHELEKVQDGLVRLAFIGDIEEADAAAFLRDIQPYLEALVAGSTLNVLVDGSRDGKIAPKARRTLTELYKDPRFGRIGVHHVKPFNRVFGTFLMKATGRHTMGFFDSEEEALKWLNEGDK